MYEIKLRLKGETRIVAATGYHDSGQALTLKMPDGPDLVFDRNAGEHPLCSYVVSKGGLKIAAVG